MKPETKHVVTQLCELAKFVLERDETTDPDIVEHFSKLCHLLTIEGEDIEEMLRRVEGEGTKPEPNSAEQN